ALGRVARSLPLVVVLLADQSQERSTELRDDLRSDTLDGEQVAFILREGGGDSLDRAVREHAECRNTPASCLFQPPRTKRLDQGGSRSSLPRRVRRLRGLAALRAGRFRSARAGA